MRKKIKFTKMSGAGNDFIVIDAKKDLNYRQLAKNICDRTDGIGADGLLVLDKSRRADHKMRIINADGSIAEMCGNGARCIAAYIVKNKKARKRNFTIDTLAGIIDCEARGETATVRLNDPFGYKTNVQIKNNGKTLHVDIINTGVPHTVVYVKGINKVDVASIGRLIRHNPLFAPKGTNVNFVEQVDKSLVNCRTYERGVEDETKACGTGSVASAIVSYFRGNPKIENKKGARMRVRTASGEILQITFDIVKSKITNVYLKGSAKFIAKGEYFI